jgi:hypothetical protein
MNAIIDSRPAFVAAVNLAVAAALDARARRMLWVDPDFVDWPLDDAPVLETLTSWLRQPQRELVLLARQFDDLRRNQPRFVAWHRMWSHAVVARAPGEEDIGELPTLLLADGVLALQLTDRVLWRGRCTNDPVEMRQWRDPLDALVQRSCAAMPATVIGL